MKTTTTWTPVEPVTGLHRGLATFGHHIGRHVLKDGTLGVYELRANPERVNKWGLIPEADYQAAEAMAAAETA